MRIRSLRFAAAFSIAISLVPGCGQKEETPTMSLNLEVQGDAEALRKNKEDPRDGFCDYYFNKKIVTAKEKNALGFCYFKAGDMKKGEIYIWKAALEDDPVAKKNKEFILAEYQKVGVERSYNYADTGRTVEEIIEGKAPQSDIVVDGAFAWLFGIQGSFPTGNLVLKNNGREESLYTVRVWYIDQERVSRSYKIEMVEMPPNLAVKVNLRGDTTFAFPSEGWMYKVEITETMNDAVLYQASGPLPIDYDGAILNN